jgi:ParB family chromosome partitioning protein
LKLRKSQTDGNLVLTGFSDIFKSTTTHMSGEQIRELSLVDLHPPEFHPFQVNDDENMSRLAKSIKQYGVREPGLARPRAEGGYELLCGNRRKRACEIAGIPVMPVIVREMDDDSAAITMVDSNLEQREKLLPSEKAWAYRVKLEALNHRGVKSDTPGQLSVEILCEQTGDCKNTIFKLIRLTDLVPDLLDLVDTKRLGFNPAVELSYLTRTDQALVVDSIAKYEIKPSISQASRIRKLMKKDELTAAAIDAILSEEKKPPKDKPLVIARFRQYFPPDHSPKQMEAVIVELLKTHYARTAT